MKMGWRVFGEAPHADNAYFAKVHCVLDDPPEVCEAGQPLTREPMNACAWEPWHHRGITFDATVREPHAFGGPSAVPGMAHGSAPIFNADCAQSAFFAEDIDGDGVIATLTSF